MLDHISYVRKYEPLTIAGVLSPNILKAVDLPKKAVLYYPVFNSTDIGIKPSHPVLKDYEGSMQADFVRELAIKDGNPRRRNAGVDREIRTYFQRNRNIRQLRDMERVLKVSGILPILNFGALSMEWTYRTSTYRPLHIVINNTNTVLAKVAELKADHEADHHIVMEMPSKLPAIRDLRRYENDEFTADNIERFTDPYKILIFEMWKWLGENSHESLFRQLGHQGLEHIHLLATNGTESIVSNLALFWEARKTTRRDEEDGYPEQNTGLTPKDTQMRFYRWLSNIVKGELLDETEEEPQEPVVKSEPKDDNAPDDGAETPVGDDDEDILVDDAMDETLDDYVLDGVDIPDDPSGAASYHIDKMVERGAMTQAEAERAKKLADSYKSLPDPFGSGQTIEEAMHLTEEDVKVKAKKYRNDGRVSDERVLSSSLDDYDERYIEQVMQKDILTNIMACQQSGRVVVKDVKIEDHVDIMNEYYKITVQTEMLGGGTSSQVFQLPKPREDGSIYVNGTRYRLRKQRIDKPIRKVGPSRVSLTSVGYGKISISRSVKAVANYERWLMRHLRMSAMDAADPRIKAFKSGNAFDRTQSLPRAYSAIAKHYRSLTLQDGMELVFDYKLTKDIKPKQKGNIVLTLDGTMEMDSTGSIYRNGTNLGRLHDILEYGKAPREHALIKIFDQEIPLGFVMAYNRGLDGLLKSCKIPHRKVPSGTRYTLEDHELAIKFQDRDLIVDVSKPDHEMIMAGFEQYYKHVRRYNYADFNKTAAYQVVLESAGVGSRYLREADDIARFFIDPITRRNLVAINEPTNIPKLFERSIELLRTEEHLKETSMKAQRLRGYEKYSSEMYKEMARSIKTADNKGQTRRSKVEVDPFGVWKRVMKDAALVLVAEQNPLHNMKEREMVTFNGEGGRSTQSMVGDTRAFHAEDCGIISEAGKDDSGVGVNIFLSTDSNITDIYGNTTQMSDSDWDNSAKFYSGIGLLSPFIDHDD